MINLKNTIIILIIILILTPMVANATRPAYTKPNFKSTWLLDIKFSKLKEENILDENNQFTFLDTKISLLSYFPAEISRIHMYGNGLTKNTSAVIYGSISRDQLEKLIEKRLKQQNNNISLVSKKYIPSGLQTISKLVFNVAGVGNAQSERILYLTDVTQGIWAASYNIKELRRWMDYPHGYMHLRKREKSQKLLSLWIDIKPTLNNLKKENAETDYLIQSNIIKQSKEFIGSIQSNESFLYFATKFTTLNENEASSINKSIDSLISLPNINGENTILSKLLSNIKRKQNKNALEISSIVLKKIFQQQNIK